MRSVDEPISSLPVPTDLIIDGNSLWARAWYATLGDPEETAPVQAGLLSVLSLLSPGSQRLGDRVDRMLVAWDGANRRDKQREPKPESYYAAKKTFHGCLDLLFSTAHAMSDAHEADDVIATAVQHSKEAGNLIFVASGDKDLQQLAGANVHIFSLNEKVLLSLRAIRERWQVKQPEQVALALAIIGDKVDRIPGVRGWGPKKAKKLFEAVTPSMDLEQALDALLAQIPEDRQLDFLTSLDLTLLRRDLPNIPEPAPVAPIEPTIVEGLNLPKVTEAYLRFYRHYLARNPLSGEDSEDVPRL